MKNEAAEAFESRKQHDMSHRRQCLETAETLVCNDRNASYGDPLQDFRRIATMWSQLLGVEVKPHQVSACMIALKLSRICHSPAHADNWFDAAGYAACGYECSLNE